MSAITRKGYVLGRSGLSPLAHAVVMLFSDPRAKEDRYADALHRLLKAITTNGSARPSPASSPTACSVDTEYEEEMQRERSHACLLQVVDHFEARVAAVSV